MYDITLVAGADRAKDTAFYREMLYLGLYPESTGQQVSWHMTMDENLTMSFGAQSIPLQARMSAALTWHVASVDGNGTATIEMRFDHASVEANGQTRSLDLPTSTFRLTSDGRMLTSTGATLFSGAPGGQFMGGGSQVSAILPDHPVAPGDTWSKHQSMTLFGNPVSFDSKATFLRTEQFKGVAASVVRTTDSVPMTLSLNLADFAGTFGFTQDQVVRLAIEKPVRFQHVGCFGERSSRGILFPLGRRE